MFTQSFTAHSLKVAVGCVVLAAAGSPAFAQKAEGSPAEQAYFKVFYLEKGLRDFKAAHPAYDEVGEPGDEPPVAAFAGSHSYTGPGPRPAPVGRFRIFYPARPERLRN